MTAYDPRRHCASYLLYFRKDIALKCLRRNKTGLVVTVYGNMSSSSSLYRQSVPTPISVIALCLLEFNLFSLGLDG